MPEERFGQLCERVCREQGWELLPSGLKLQLAGGRKQMVSLELFSHAGRDLVRILSTIGRADQLAPSLLMDALIANATLAHGALAVRDGDLVLTDTLDVADTDEGELVASLSYLGERGDFFERTLFGGDEY